MALSTTNCYVTRSDALTYFGDRVDASAFLDADTARQDQALVTATSLLDELTWTGIVEDEDQPLAFPRKGSYFDPRLGYEICFTAGVIPNQIKIANYELGLHLLTNEGLLDNTGNVQSLSVGPINLQRIGVSSVIPATVRRKIRPLLVNGGSSTWWRAN